jgi:hypothetical protein
MFKCCKTAYTGLIKHKADTSIKSKHDEMLARVEKDLQKLNN